MKAFFFILAYPLAEIAGFVLVGGWIGLLPTLGLVLLSAGAGVLVLRQQAVAAGQDLRGTLNDVRKPLTQLAQGVLIVLGAILLILPGFVSDLAALPLLIPPLRRALVVALSGRIARQARTTPRSAPADASIIDGTFYEVDPDAPPPSRDDRPSGWTRH